MDALKKQQVLGQYIDQYKPIVDRTLTALRENRDILHIPYAQFLFSLIDYYGLIYTVAATAHYNKKEKHNFLKFFASPYFPVKDRCKKSFLYFMRNGLIHQIFPKLSSVGTSSENNLFFKDIANGNIIGLNLNYLDKIVCDAIDHLTNDLNNDTTYIENLYRILIEENFIFKDDIELATELNGSYDGDINNVLNDCI